METSSPASRLSRGNSESHRLLAGRVDPEEGSLVTEKSKAGKTLMAGDGFNDAGLLVPDVGIAVGSEQVNSMRGCPDSGR